MAVKRFMDTDTQYLLPAMISTGRHTVYLRHTHTSTEYMHLNLCYIYRIRTLEFEDTYS